jgi:hypothetical protein
MAKSNWEFAYNTTMAEHAVLRTKAQRMTRGYSCFPELNVGVYFDSRNAKYDQPNHPLWRGSNEWGLTAPCRLKYLGCGL